MKRVRVLVVDDSPTMRGVIAATLSRDPGVEVVGQAGDPLEARAAIKALNPDVMTLDVEMPNMNGLDFLDKVMRLRPFPVVMVSSLTEKGAATALAALELGAVECVCKPSAQDPDSFAALPLVVKTAAQARLTHAAPVARKPAAAPHRWNGDVVAIGASTGCVEALMALIPHFPADCPPTVITVHMPAEFTRSFARRLDGATAAQVTEALDGAPLAQGRIFLAPGTNTHLTLLGGAGAPKCRLRAGDPVNGHRPSVDALFHSVAAACGPKAVGVILTGMGRDGAAGLMAMRERGARTLGQNEASCVVYGMPKVAAQMGAVEQEMSIQQIGPRLMQLTSHSNGR